MARNTKIEWTQDTWNPITGCSVVSPGCTNCYAMKLAGTRLRHHPSRAGLTAESKAGPVWNGQVRLNEQWLTDPLRWRKPRRIFVCAHGDLFHESVPDEWIDRVFAVMALCPQHTFQILTKRPERMRAYLTAEYKRANTLDAASHMARDWKENARAVWHAETWPLSNVWLGTSVEDQQRADERVPHLLATPAVVRFLSCEPLLGPVNITDAMWGGEGDPLADLTAKIDWIIVGGESGPGARPMHPDWARSLRDQCAAAGVPFFFKQIGEWGWPSIEQHHEDYAAACNGEGPWRGDKLMEADGTILPGTSMQIGSRIYIRKVGKKAAGRLLDGVEYSGMPANV